MPVNFFSGFFGIKLQKMSRIVFDCRTEGNDAAMISFVEIPHVIMSVSANATTS
jgi:hypothetical protein